MSPQLSMVFRAAVALLAAAIVLVAFPTLSWSNGRTLLPPGGKKIAPHPMSGITVQTAGLEELLDCLLGPNVTVSNASLIAADSAAGTFTGGLAALGINSGIVLSSGNITSLVGPNLLDDTTTDNAAPGDADLDALIPGFKTNDAAILQFEFECTTQVVISFQYVFASEEYNEFVDSEFNDVFGFFVNGTAVANNIAIVPATCSDPGIPVAINNVNCENPYNPPTGLNCNCFRNNDLQDGGGTIDTEMDGLTQVFSATATINPGINTIKIAIADAGDFDLDSNVMLACQSFVCAEAPSTGACCPPTGGCVVTTSVQCEAGGGVFAGAGTTCSPDPCKVPVHRSTWGRVKKLYRD